MKTLMKFIHAGACIAAIAVMWGFLGRFGGHFENGIWDSNAITASVLLVIGMLCIILHLTYFLVKITGDRKTKTE